MAKDRLLVGLEIGTFKVCAVVGEARPDGSLRILGVGESKSVGIRKGEIVDFNNAIQCVRDAIADAEDKADAEIESVWASVTGAHIQSFNNRGVTPISAGSRRNRRGRHPRCRDQRQGSEHSRPEGGSSTRSRSTTTWTTRKASRDPGSAWSATQSRPTLTSSARRQDPTFKATLRCIKEAGVEVEEVVINSVASAQVVLDQHQKDPRGDRPGYRRRHHGLPRLHRWRGAAQRRPRHRR